MKFSERKGFTKPKTHIQLDSIDDDLRNKLWNALDTCFWNQIIGDNLNSSPEIEGLVKSIWHSLFKQRLETISYRWSNTLNVIRAHFFECEWWEVYDFIEFVLVNYPYTYSRPGLKDFFKTQCNVVLTEEISGYRFVGDELVDITSSEEMAEVEKAISSPVAPAREHLKRALELYSDKKKPDYRNSVKESISAVEAMCRFIAKDDKATLADAIKVLEQSGKIHTAFKDALIKLYGYTSDAGGIRHALIDVNVIKQEEALYFLVSCSAFVNYLNSKQS
jgi:hypothetical protein